jgi:NAD(P) transhydrogenase
VQDTYDLVVIGSGPAGQSSASVASAFGHRSIIVEMNKPGGTVTTTGGAPTKTLREAALYFTGFHERDVYGVTIAAPPEVALRKVRDRTRYASELLQNLIKQQIADWGIDYIEGTARIAGNRTVVVTASDGRERTLSAKVVIIASGSRPLRPSNMPFDDPALWDTDNIFSIGRMPADLLIVGGGAVAVEFATIFRALGITVRLCSRQDTLLPMMDREITGRLAQLIEQWGVELFLGAGAETVDRVNGRLTVTLSSGECLQPEAVLFAAGRVPNTEGLGLQDIGVQLGERGSIIVNDQFRTTAEGIYAVGDVIAPSLASIAMEQGRCAACHAFGIPFKHVVDPLSVSAVYGMPEVAGVGLTEEQCRAQQIDYEVGRSDLATTARGAITGHGGLLKLLFRKDDRRLLGVHCLGDIASELVGIGQMVIHFGGGLDDLNAVTLNTPTYAYAYKYAMFDGLLRLRLSGADVLSNHRAAHSRNAVSQDGFH